MIKRFICSSGSNTRTVYEPYFCDTGARQLRAVGVEDINAFIQSFRDSTDINVILKRFELGDVSVLNAKRGVYGDFSNAPKTLSEFLNAQIQAQNIFERLPAAVKASFNNDVNQFFVQYGSESWLKTIEPFLPKDSSEVSNETSIQEVISNES